MMLIRQHISRGWKRLHADLLALAQTASNRPDGASENLIGATDLYKILGGHRIWFDAEEWRGFLETLCPSQPAPMLQPCTLDLRRLVQEVGRATGGERRKVQADVLVLDSPLNQRDERSRSVSRGTQGEYQTPVSTMLFKQVQADLDVICEALAPSETISIFKVTREKIAQ
jgi:hypothetical protein